MSVKAKTCRQTFYHRSRVCFRLMQLGGKSPVVVDSSANLKLAARRIVRIAGIEAAKNQPCLFIPCRSRSRVVFFLSQAWGKWAVNCGQTCIAPDYILVDRKLQVSRASGWNPHSYASCFFFFFFFSDVHHDLAPPPPTCNRTL